MVFNCIFYITYLHSIILLYVCVSFSHTHTTRCSIASHIDNEILFLYFLIFIVRHILFRDLFSRVFPPGLPISG